MPAYNCEKYISKTIDSVKSQTYTNWELIIVDDCSTDSTRDIISHYQKSCDKIHFFQMPQNSGVAKTRNLGIEKAQGQYIALLDSDDIWRENKLEEQLKLAIKQQAQIIYCSYGLIDAEGNNLKRDFIVPESTNFDKMLISSVISCSTAMLESQLFKKHPFRDEYYHEDLVLWLELLSIPVKACGVKAILADYRQVCGSRSNKKLHAAIGRWKIYRECFKIPFFKSAVIFVQYALKGFIKYY